MEPCRHPKGGHSRDEGQPLRMPCLQCPQAEPLQLVGHRGEPPRLNVIHQSDCVRGDYFLRSKTMQRFIGLNRTLNWARKDTTSQSTPVIEELYDGTYWPPSVYVPPHSELMVVYYCRLLLFSRSGINLLTNTCVFSMKYICLFNNVYNI